MSRLHYGHSTLSGLVDSDSEDATYGVLDAQSSPNLVAENLVASKNRRENQRGTVGKNMKAKTSGRRTSASRAVAGKRGKRAPLSDKTNQQYASDTEEVEDFEQQDVTVTTLASGDELDASVMAIQKQNSRPTKQKPSTKANRVGAASSHAEFSLQPESPERRPAGSRIAASGKPQGQGRRQASVEQKQHFEIIQETQVSTMDMDDNGDGDIEEETLRPATRYMSVPRATSQPRQTSVPRRRAGSASDTERNDPAVRRKLGEMTKKFENLDLKYRNLREIGLKEAEHNFERLKKQSAESQKGTSLSAFK